ncbi:MAG TPA: FecR domain-containing protein [Candidatus Acidoferrum sp.]|nr:FecR domain-containing protein [Candidatus Acidoferrum sp.]
MKFFRSKQDANLDQAISHLRGEELDSKTLTASAERVWQKLQAAEGAEAAASSLQPIRGCADIRSLVPAFHRHELPPARALIVEDHLRECVSCRSFAHGRRVDGSTSLHWRLESSSRGFQWSFAKLAFASATVILLAAVAWTGRTWYVAGPPGSRARVDSIEGQAYLVGMSGEHSLKPGDEVGQGDFIRTAANSHAKVRLFDGSEVEMNQRAQLAVSANRRNTTIHLDQGNIIVQAAKRHTGHLYVSAPDCTVSVTGTVFSVNSGTKGSRVAVIEGEVRVKHSGRESILHSGDEVATTQSVGLVPVREEIAWSSDLDHQLALLAEFSKLRAKLNEIQTPGPRYASKILPFMPADTVLYIGIPNLGDALQQANQIFQQQLSQSKVLQDWWNKSGNSNQHPTPEELIEQIRTMSQYLGDEVVITFRGSSIAMENGPVLLAEIRQPGLKDFLQNNLADTLANHRGASDLHVVDPQSLSALAGGQRGMIMLVRPDMLIVGGDAASVQHMSAQIDAGASSFSGTDFGKRIANVYSHGTETLVAANLGQLLNSTHTQHADSTALRNSGFNDIKYLIASRGEPSSQGDNRITFEFNGPRHGIASWLAPPAPMGSLDYVSSNAGAAVSFVAKQPALMLDDLFSTIGANDPNFSQNLAKTNSELGLDLRNDLASALGGEMTLALDGPVLPTPSWKAIIEVNDSGSLQLAIEKLVQGLNREAERANRPGMTLNQTQVGGRTFYTIQLQSVGLSTEYDYTFADGYMIVAPSRALLLAALQTHADGSSLAHSVSFHSLLPTDNHANFSAMLYQNLSPILKPLASQLNSGQLAVLQQLAADAKPSVFCAYGESDRIEVASSGKLFDLNPSVLTLFHLLGVSEHGTSRIPNPY